MEEDSLVITNGMTNSSFFLLYTLRKKKKLCRLFTYTEIFILATPNRGKNILIDNSYKIYMDGGRATLIKYFFVYITIPSGRTQF